MKLGELVQNPSPLTVQDDDSVSLALQTMLWGDVRHLPVLRDGTVVGVISERDLLAHQVRRGRPGRNDMVHTMMSRPPVLASPEDDAGPAARLVLERRIGCLPLVRDGRLAGIVTRSDLIRAARMDERDEAAPPTQNESGGVRVRDVMRITPLTAKADDALLDAVSRMEMRGVRHLPVVEPGGQVVGILSERDVRAAFGAAMRPDQSDVVMRIEAVRVGDVMTRGPFTISEGATLDEAARALADHRVGALPVVGEPDRSLVGIVSYVDVLHAYAGRQRSSSTGGA